MSVFVEKYDPGHFKDDHIMHTKLLPGSLFWLSSIILTLALLGWFVTDVFSVFVALIILGTSSVVLWFMFIEEFGWSRACRELYSFRRKRIYLSIMSTDRWELVPSNKRAQPIISNLAFQSKFIEYADYIRQTDNHRIKQEYDDNKTAQNYLYDLFKEVEKIHKMNAPTQNPASIVDKDFMNAVIQTRKDMEKLK